MNTLLSKDPVVKTHLPWTCSYRWSVIERELDAGHSVLLKPQIGSVGRGIIRLVPLSDRRVQLTGGFTLTIPMRKLAKTLRSKIRPNRYLIQQYITLARYNGKLFDLRVPVQRDGLGTWKVPDIVAKVAGKHPFLTNIAQGGRALPGEIVMKKAFPPPKAEEAIAAVERLAIAVAQAVSKTYRYAADLGLDIGVDTAGKPWLIEVNTRDQRITFFEAGLHRAFRTIYRNPLAYCAHLMTSSRGR